MFWLLIAGGSIYILPIFGADQLNKFYITSTYFLSFAVLGGYYYKINLTLPHHTPFNKQLVFIAAASLGLIVVCLLIDTVFHINSDVYKKIISSKFYFPLFQIESVVTKICDIAFQQVFIFGLLKKMKEESLSDIQVLKLFSISFFMIHVPLIFSFDLLYAFYFIIPSLFAGLVFSYLILNYRYGQSISFAVHLLFYLLIGIYLRI